MKIAIAGGGSTYSPELAEGLARRAAALDLRELALFDVDPERLSIVGGFVQRMVAAIAPEVRVTQHRTIDPAVFAADFVVIQIRAGGQNARAADERRALKYGFIGQETTGAGGFAKALRTIPAVLEIAKRVELVAPNAWIINFTNPVSIVTQALLNLSSARSIGLCNIPIGQRREIAAFYGVDPAEVVVDSVGLNHLSFIRGVEVRGKEVLPELIEKMPEVEVPREVVRLLGMIPSDYLQYFYTRREALAAQQARDRTRAEEVMEIERELLAAYADAARVEKPEALSKRGGAFYSHAALEIIEAIHGDRGDRLTVDVRNGSTLFELPPESCIEVPCLVGRSGARPLPQRPLPAVIRGLIQSVKAYEELAIKAALSRAEKDVFAALIAHPLIDSGVEAARLAREIAD